MYDTAFLKRFSSSVSLFLILALVFPSVSFAADAGETDGSEPDVGANVGYSQGFGGSGDLGNTSGTGDASNSSQGGLGDGPEGTASGEYGSDGDHSTGFEGSPEIGGSRDADADGTPDAREGQNAAEMADRASAAGFDVDRQATINGQIGGSLGNNQVSINGKSYDIAAVEKAGAALDNAPLTGSVDRQATLDRYQMAAQNPYEHISPLGICDGCVVGKNSGYVGTPTEVAYAEVDFAINNEVGTRSIGNTAFSETEIAKAFAETQQNLATNLALALSPISAANWNAEQAPLTGGFQPNLNAFDPTPMSNQGSVNVTGRGTAGDMAGEAAYEQAQPEVAGVFSTFGADGTQEITVTVMSDGSATGRATTRDPGGFQHSISLSEAEVAQALGHVPTALDPIGNRGLTAINSSGVIGVNLGLTQTAFVPELTKEQIANLSIFSPQNIPEQNLVIDKQSMTGTTITVSPAGGTFASSHTSEELDRIAEINKTNPAAAEQLADAYAKAVDASFKSDHITNQNDKATAVALNEAVLEAVKSAIEGIEKGGFLTGATGQLAIDEPFNRDIARADDAANAALSFAENAARASSLQNQRNEVTNKFGAEARTLDAEIQATNLAKGAAYADVAATLSQSREDAVRANTLEAMADIAAKHAETARGELANALGVTGLEAQTRALDDAAQNIARDAATTVEALRDAAVRGNLGLRDDSAQVSARGGLTSSRQAVEAELAKQGIDTLTVPTWDDSVLTTDAIRNDMIDDRIALGMTPEQAVKSVQREADLLNFVAGWIPSLMDAFDYRAASKDERYSEDVREALSNLADANAKAAAIELGLEVAAGVGLGMVGKYMEPMGIGNLGREVDDVANDFIGQSTALPDYPAYNPNVGSQMSEFAIDVKTNYDLETGKFGTPEVSVRSIAANDNLPSPAVGAAAARDLSVAANDASSALTATKNAVDNIAPESVDPVFERSLAEVDTKLTDAIGRSPNELSSPQVESYFGDINKAIDAVQDLAEKTPTGRAGSELGQALDNLEREVSDFAEQSARMAAINELPGGGATVANDTLPALDITNNRAAESARMTAINELPEAGAAATKATNDAITTIEAVDPPLQRALDQIEIARREFADDVVARETAQLIKEMDEALGRAAEQHVAAAEAAQKVEDSLAAFYKDVEDVVKAADEDRLEALIRDMEADIGRAVDEKVRLSEINETLDDSVAGLTRTLDDMRRAADEDAVVKASLEQIEPAVVRAVDESVSASQALKSADDAVDAARLSAERLSAEAQNIASAAPGRQGSVAQTGRTGSVASRAVNVAVAASVFVTSMLPVGPTVRALTRAFDVPNPVARIVDEAVDVAGSRSSKTNASLFAKGERTFSASEIALTGRTIAGEAEAAALGRFVGEFNRNGNNVVVALEALTLSDMQDVAVPINVGNNRYDPVNPDRNTLDKVYKAGQNDGIRNNGQFSTFNESNVQKDDAKYAKDKAAYDALAKAFLDGTVESRYGTKAAVPVPNATHYVADYIRQPSWTNNLNRVAHVGKHYVYTVEGTNFKIDEIDQAILLQGSNNLALHIPTPRPENVSTAATNVNKGYSPGWLDNLLERLGRMDEAQGATVKITLPAIDLDSVARVVLNNKGAIRDWPITEDLRSKIEVGLDLIKARHGEDVRFVVTSGGQPSIGIKGVDRTGSHRHDNGNSSDGYLQNDKTGHIYDFTNPDDLPVFKTFIEGTTKAGVNGVGADVDYMGPNTVHVGGGSVANWGMGLVKNQAGKWVKTTSSKFSPQWLKDSHAEGLKQRSGFNFAEYKAGKKPVEVDNQQSASIEKEPAPPRANEQVVVSPELKAKANELTRQIRADLDRTAPTPKTPTRQIIEGANKGFVTGVGWVAEKLSQAATAVENARTSLNQWAGREPAPVPSAQSADVTSQINQLQERINTRQAEIEKIMAERNVSRQDTVETLQQAIGPKLANEYFTLTQTRGVLDRAMEQASTDPARAAAYVEAAKRDLDSFKSELAQVAKTPDQQITTAIDNSANGANVVNVVFAPTFDALSITTGPLGAALPQNANIKTIYVGDGQNLSALLSTLAALPPGTQINLIGWSKGAMAALYIANQLNDFGQPVANLLMVDPGQGTVGVALAELPSIDLVTGKVGVPNNVQNVKVYKPQGGGTFQKQFVEPNILENAMLGTSERQPNGFKGLNSADIIEVDAGVAIGPRGVGFAHMGIGKQGAVISSIAEAVKNSQTQAVATKPAVQAGVQQVAIDQNIFDQLSNALKGLEKKTVGDNYVYSTPTGQIYDFRIKDGAFEMGITGKNLEIMVNGRNQINIKAKNPADSLKTTLTNKNVPTVLDGRMVIDIYNEGSIVVDGEMVVSKGGQNAPSAELTVTINGDGISVSGKSFLDKGTAAIIQARAEQDSAQPISEIAKKISDAAGVIKTGEAGQVQLAQAVSNDQVASIANPKVETVATEAGVASALEVMRGNIASRVGTIEAELARTDITPEAVTALTNELSKIKAASSLLVDAKTKASAGDFSGAQGLIDQARSIFDTRNNTGSLGASLDAWDFALLGGIGFGLASLLSKLYGTLRSGGSLNPFARLSTMRGGNRTQSPEGAGTGGAGVRATAVNDNVGPTVRSDDSNLNFKTKYGKSAGSRIENAGIVIGILSAIALLIKKLLEDDDVASSQQSGKANGSGDEENDPAGGKKSLLDRIKDFLKGGGGLPVQDNSNTATSTAATKGVVTVKVTRDLNSDQFDLQVTDVSASAEYAESLAVDDEEETEYLEDDQPSIIFNEYNEVVYSDGTFAPVTVDGVQIDESEFEYMYIVEYYDNGEPVTIDANADRLPENLLADVASYLFRDRGTFTLGDVSYITRAFYDPKPDVPRDELYEYTIILKDASVRKVLVPEFTSYVFLSAKFAEVGFEGDVLYLVAEAQDISRVSDTNLLKIATQTIANGFASIKELLGIGSGIEDAATDLNTLTPTNDGVVTINDIRKATVFFGIEAECPDAAGVNSPYLYEIVIAKEALPNAYSDLSFRALRCGTGDKQTYTNEIASHLESLAGFGEIDRMALYSMLRFGDLSGLTFEEEPTANGDEDVEAEEEATDEEAVPLVPNTTNEVSFEVKAVNASGNVLADWVYGDLEISSGVQLFFRWDAPNYAQCLPFLNDNGLYSLTRVNDPSLNTGNTEAEGFNVREGTLTYRLECGGQANGETGVDIREVNVVVGN